MIEKRARQSTGVRLFDINFLINKLEKEFNYNRDINPSGSAAPTHLFDDLEDKIWDYVQFKEIPEKIANEYFQIIEPVRRKGLIEFLDNDYIQEQIQKLKEINKQHTEDWDKANEKLIDVFKFKWENDGNYIPEKDRNDSKKELEHINDLMRFYESSYSHDDGFESVDDLVELVNGIKEAVKNKNISEATAKELLEPLQDIKKNIFNDEIHKQKIGEFNQILQTVNGKEGKGALESVVNGAKSLNIGKEESQHAMTAMDTAKTQDEADKALENQRQASKENTGVINESQEKTVREQVNKNEEEKTQDKFAAFRQQLTPKVQEGIRPEQTQEQKSEGRVRRADYPSFRAGIDAILHKYKDQEQNVVQNQPKEEQKTQDKFATFRQQLKPKESLERKENTDAPKIDKPAAFKEGIKKTKQLAKTRQQEMMAYLMKKRKLEWEDF